MEDRDQSQPQSKRKGKWDQAHEKKQMGHVDSQRLILSKITKTKLNNLGSGNQAGEENRWKKNHRCPQQPTNSHSVTYHIKASKFIQGISLSSLVQQLQ